MKAGTLEYLIPIEGTEFVLYQVFPQEVITRLEMQNTRDKVVFALLIVLIVGTLGSRILYIIHKREVIDSKNKPKTEEKPKKPNLGINKKHHDESVDDTSKAESTNDITLGNTEDVSIDSKEDVKIDNDEDIKF